MSDDTQIAAASNYLRYLPAVFSKAADDFLARYLKIFEKLFTGLSDATLDGRRGIQQLLAAEVIGNLFYSRFSFLFPPSNHDFIPLISGLPQKQQDELLTLFDSFIGVPTAPHPLAGHVAALSSGGDDALAAFKAWLDDLLTWLASWVNMVLDSSWSLDKKRRVIAEIVALYRLRGTAAGLGMLIDLLLDLPMPVHCYTPQGFAQVTGPVSVSVVNPQPSAITLTEKADKNSFVLQCAYRPGAPLVSGYAPWLFFVRVALPAYTDPAKVLDKVGAEQVQTLLAKLTVVLDAAKPAASCYQIQILGGMCLQPYPEPSSSSSSTPYPPQLNLNAVLSTQMPTP